LPLHIAYDGIAIPQQTDVLHAMGYYRFGPSFGTTSIVRTPSHEYAEIEWARVDIEKFAPPKRYARLLRKNRDYTLAGAPFAINDEVNDLFSAYLTYIDFEPADSVTDYLYGGPYRPLFHTTMLQLRDQQKLIANLYLDLGIDSISAILNFFHPAYAASSPGLFMYLSSIILAKQHGFRWFYPGYIAINYSKFDYKLEAGRDCTEVWEPDAQKWIPYEQSRHAASFR
jgi:arginine-tRNA-protein transferase